MAKEITIEQLQNFADRLIREVPKILDDAKRLSANNAKGLITARIFNDGKDSKEAALNYTNAKTARAGAYSKGHARKRSKAGRQIGHVDLQQTDRLFNAVQVIEGSSGPYLGILKPRSKGRITNPELAGVLEKMYKTGIFEPSEGEFEKIMQSVESYTAKQFDNLVRAHL